MSTKTSKKTYAERLAFLPPEMREFALHDEDTKKDILEQNLDQEEILSIASVNMHHQKLAKKQKITMNIPNYTLQAIKISAQKLGVPYQTFISSILHQYATKQLSHKVK